MTLSILGSTCAQVLDHPLPTTTLQQRLSFHIHLKPEHEDSNPNPVSFAFSGSLTPITVGSKPKPTIHYHDSLYNHTASIKGSIYESCGEFMPSESDGSVASLKCIACEYHQNFHHKEVVAPSLSLSPSLLLFLSLPPSLSFFLPDLFWVATRLQPKKI